MATATKSKTSLKLVFVLGAHIHFMYRYGNLLGFLVSILISFSVLMDMKNAWMLLRPSQTLNSICYKCSAILKILYFTCTHLHLLCKNGVGFEYCINIAISATLLNDLISDCLFLSVTQTDTAPSKFESSAARDLKLDDTALSNILRLEISTREKTKGPLLYEKIEKYLTNGQVHTKQFTMKILQVYHVTLTNEPKFTKTGMRMWLWHGSPAKNLSSILSKGLQLPVIHNCGLMGNGIYFADRASKSGQYCKNLSAGNKDGYIYLCNVFLGKVQFPMEPNNHLTAAPPGYNTAICKGETIPDISHDEFCQASLLPLGPPVLNTGSKLATRPGNYLMFNEYVVYDPSQIQLKYIVHFRLT